MTEKNNFHPFQALIVGSLLLFFFTFLFFYKSTLGGSDYLGLVFVSTICSFIVYFRESIQEFSIKEMRVVLRETQNTKEEINKTAYKMAKIIASLSVYSSGSWKNRKELNDRIEELLDSINAESAKKQSILEMPRLMEKFMKNGKEPLTEIEKAKINKVFEVEEG